MRNFLPQCRESCLITPSLSPSLLHSLLFTPLPVPPIVCGTAGSGRHKQSLATPLLIGLCRQLVSADRGGCEFSLEADANVVSPPQKDFFGQDGQILDGDRRADLSLVAVGVHHEGCGGAVIRVERNPAVDVVFCVLFGSEHFVVFHVAFPFGGGKTTECESMAGRGVEGLWKEKITEPETEEGSNSYIGDGSICAMHRHNSCPVAKRSISQTTSVRSADTNTHSLTFPGDPP